MRSFREIIGMGQLLPGRRWCGLLGVICGWLVASPAWAMDGMTVLDATRHPLSALLLGVFILAYAAVVLEEKLHLSKSRPVVLAAGVMWVIAALIAADSGVSDEVIHGAVIANLGEYAQLLLFITVALVYIKRIEERGVFEALKQVLVNRGFGYRALFWITGVVAFFVSAVADNLTTALVMGTVVMAVGKGQPRFVQLGCINVVVAANAGGAFSPFGDITTLMVWQAGKVDFFTFFHLFLPSLVCFLIPAALMTFALPKGRGEVGHRRFHMKPLARRTCLLFALTIALAVSFEHWLGLPPYLGMMSGLSLLLLVDYFQARVLPHDDPQLAKNPFEDISDPEWDTLLFFFGVMYCVGALAFIGYLHLVATQLYGGLGATSANVLIGFLSAVIDNIPVMFAVLQMDPEMSVTQWLLVTLTAGTGGSMLAVGSAAGVGLMGIARGQYTFMGHLRWSWAVMLGFLAGIWVLLALPVAA